MNSPRGRLPVRPKPPKIPASAALLLSATLASACSSAASGDFVGTTDFDDSAGGGVSSGGGSSATGPVTSGGGGTSSTSSGTSGGDTGDPGGTTGGPGDIPPPDAQGPTDEVEAQNLPMGNTCDEGSSVAWRLALHDGAAMSAASQAREAMLGIWPLISGVALAPSQFLNYYTFPYAPAADGTLELAAQLRPGEDALGDKVELQLAIRAPVLAPADRPPVHLTLALDNSGSMEGKGLDLLRLAGFALASQLREGDTVAVATWDAKLAVLLPTTTVAGPSDPKLTEVLSAFATGGGATLSDGLMNGLALANEAYVATDINRLVVITDGGAAMTTEDLDIVAKAASDEPGKPGIHVVGVGVGEAKQYRDDLIHALAAAGGGPALFVGSEAEAKRQLKERFLSVVGLAALDVQARLILPPGLDVAHDGAVDGLTPQKERVLLAPNDNLVLHRTLRACVDAVDPAATIAAEVTWVDPQTGELKQSLAQWPLGDLLAGETAALAKGIAVLAYVEALAAAQAESLDPAPLSGAEARLADAQALLPEDPELVEIAAVLAVLKEL